MSNIYDKCSVKSGEVDFFSTFLKISSLKVLQFGKKPYLCTRFREATRLRLKRKMILDNIPYRQSSTSLLHFYEM